MDSKAQTRGAQLASSAATGKTSVMARGARTYVRFVCYQQVEGRHQRLGLFQALDQAREDDAAPPWALKELGEANGWFKINLAIPKQFSLGGWKDSGQPGLSWFKPAAEEHIRRMHGLKLALEACGVNVDMLTTRDPGLIVWQDRHQVVAEPGDRRF